MKKELVFGIIGTALVAALTWGLAGQYPSPRMIVPQNRAVDQGANLPAGGGDSPSNSLGNSTGVSLTLAEVAKHNSSGDCWVIVSNQVYDVTNFLSSHSGGSGAILPYCGGDATMAFQTKDGQGQHASQDMAILNTMLLGPVGVKTTNQNTQNPGKIPTQNPTPASANPNSNPPASQPAAGNPATVALTPAEIAKHNSANDCWIIVSNQVYNVTSYIPVHPGGPGRIIPYCGGDATVAFQTKGGQGQHSAQADAALAQLLLGPVNGQAASPNPPPANPNPVSPATGGDEYESD
jgi:cytochrome b involved in lipid metabolism